MSVNSSQTNGGSGSGDDAGFGGLEPQVFIKIYFIIIYKLNFIIRFIKYMLQFVQLVPYKILYIKK